MTEDNSFALCTCKLTKPLIYSIIDWNCACRFVDFIAF